MPRFKDIYGSFSDRKRCRFDHPGQLRFICNPFNGYLHVKILSINLKNMFIIDDPQMRINLNETRKFKDIDGNF